MGKWLDKRRAEVESGERPIMSKAAERFISAWFWGPIGLFVILAALYAVLR